MPSKPIIPYSDDYYFRLWQDSFMANMDLFLKEDIEKMSESQIDTTIDCLKMRPDVLYEPMREWEIKLINRIKDIHGII